MAWLKTLNKGLTCKAIKWSAITSATMLIAACNVGKTDTVTTTTGGSTTSLSGSCTGSYVGGYSMPDHETRVANRNQSLTDRGIAISADEEENNRNAGGGPPDGGIWLSGSFQFETDGNCNIIKSDVTIFTYTGYSVNGTVNKNGTFNLVWSGNGSVGEMEGAIDANKAITGKFHHPAPDTYVHGVLSGTFTPNGKI